MIQFQFIRQAAFTSDVIAWFTEGGFSHVDCVLPTGMLLGSRSDRVKGNPAGVQIRPPDYAKFALKVVLQIPAAKQEEDLFYDWLYSQLGKPYDKPAIWGFALDRNWRDSNSWFCSELIAAGLEEVGIMRKIYAPTNRVSPNMLASVVSAIGGRRIEELD